MNLLHLRTRDHELPASFPSISPTYTSLPSHYLSLFDGTGARSTLLGRVEWFHYRSATRLLTNRLYVQQLYTFIIHILHALVRFYYLSFSVLPFYQVKYSFITCLFFSSSQICRYFLNPWLNRRLTCNRSVISVAIFHALKVSLLCSRLVFTLGIHGGAAAFHRSVNPAPSARRHHAHQNKKGITLMHAKTLKIE